MPQSGIFDPSLRSLETSGKPAFLYHYGDINLWLNIDGRASM